MSAENNDQTNSSPAAPVYKPRLRVPGTAMPVAAAAATADPGGEEAGESGESGVHPPAGPQVTNAEFVASVIRNVPNEASAAVCSLTGVPNGEGGWPAQRADDIDRLCPPSRNNYLSRSSLVADEQGQFRARKKQFAALHFLLLDDVGSKVDWAKLEGFEPTWVIETSPGNSQVGIRLTDPLTDLAEAEALESAIVAAGLTDAGIKGIVGWARLPVAINGKEKHVQTDGSPFQCRLTAFNADVSYTPDELVDALGLILEPAKPGVRPPTGLSIRSLQLEQGDDVYTPKPSESPVVSALKAHGLYKREIEPGKHDVTCPWVHEHTDALDTGAAYFEPSDQFPIGGFCCQHSHRDNYHVGKLLDHLGVSGDDARWKARIRLVPGEINRVIDAAERVLALRGAHFQSGDLIVSIATDAATGDISMVPVSEQALTKELSAAADWEKFDGRTRKWMRCDPPARHVNMLHRAQTLQYLPHLTGLARQPYFRADGHLVTESGYDAISQRFAAFDPGEFALPEPTREAAEAALELLNGVLEEFRFATEGDKAAAISAFLTAVTRTSLDLAPAYHFTAPTMGSGKSYACSIIAAFAGPSDSLKVSFPTTSEEATKSIQSLLLQAPSSIEFDDMSEDWKPHGVINRMLTSTTITDRILGVSRVATVSTRTLLLASGNNVGPVRDLLRRVVTVRLDARCASPATIEYRGRPLERVRRERGRFVAAVLTIILAWEKAGRIKADVPSIASYGGQWADYCRHPLIWLGLDDPAAGLLEQIRRDPGSDALSEFLVEWRKAFGSEAITIRRALDFCQTSEGEDLREAISDLPVIERDTINRHKLGWYLKKNVDRIVEGLQLKRASTSERTAWRVLEAPGYDAPLPALPVSPGPVRETRDQFD